MLRALLIASCLSCVLASTSAAAANWPSVTMQPAWTGGGENDAAVVIGISAYSSLPPIPGAADNAKDWFSYLTRTRGIPLDRIRILADNDATKEEIEAVTKDLADKVGQGGTVWFIFIGHGAPNAAHDDGLLVGYDTQVNEKSLEARGVPQKFVTSTIEADPKHANAIFIWDACFSGTTGDGKALVPGSQATLPVKRIAAGAAGRAAIFSASDQVAGPLPNHDRPAFTYLMLGALRGWADKPPVGNNDGQVTTVEAFNYARDTLRKVVHGRVQVPSMQGSAQPFVLSKGASEAGPDLVSLIVDSGGAAKSGGELFKQRTLVVPVIDVNSMKGTFALGEMNMEAEKAFDNASYEQDSSTSTPDAKRGAWCALAGITDRNPYLETAQAACSQWSNYVAAEKEMTANMTSDFGVLVQYMELRRGNDMKLAAVDSFIDVYGKYPDRQEVVAAKVARDNLSQGKPAGIALDTDGDHLIIDSCPDEAEDFDGDNDSDGCPEKGVGDVVGEGIDDVEDAIEDAGIHFYIFDFENPFYQSGIGGGLGVYDEVGVPTKFNQPTFRPSLGWSNRLGWGPLEAGANIDWDMSRDLDDEALTLDAYAGVRVIGISAWTPSVGVDYRNAFDWAPDRVGGPGVYFGNVFNIENAVALRVTYRYGLEAPGSIVPVHSVFAELLITVASPKGSACLSLLDELD
jgi:hypothetical protein